MFSSCLLNLLLDDPGKSLKEIESRNVLPDGTFKKNFPGKSEEEIRKMAEKMAEEHPNIRC